MGGMLMPLFMDIHRNMIGLTDDGIADAHRKDLAVQKKYGVEFLRYWYNKADGTVMCLCHAPTKDAAVAVHREAHGGIPEEIIEVQEGE